ncbi:FxSxx-COOH system tetratricopeptide repeat protein [Nonomuraea sp. NPDC046570]|uniref:FxSxx-COOH system tetratricopeptide repeat protein n=1 Tax=Nonomuraea sp. NPDC046570 TaxID=3155255 RepID=UPI0033ECD618
MTEASVIAFHSVRAGVGRTMALCNAAVVLAAAGRRVLVLDEEPAAPALRRYLSRLGTAGAGSFQPVHLNGGQVDWAGRVLSLGGPGERLDYAVATLAPAAAAAQALHAAPYDHILINLRSGAETAALTWVAQVCHQIVTCFALSPAAIEEAQDVAATIERQAGGDVRVVPVPARVDAAGGEALEAARERVRAAFPGGTGVEIPYDAGYYFTDSLAVLHEPPGAEHGLRRAYERLAETLSGGAVTTLTGVYVVHTPRHQLWAEWIGSQIERSGVRVEEMPIADYLARTPVDLLAGDAGAAVLLVSPTRLSAPDEELVRQLTSAPRHQGRGLFTVRVDDAPAQVPVSALDEIDLRAGEEGEAVAELRARLGISGPLPAEAAGAARFPRADQRVELPARNPAFAGRSTLIQRLRARLGPQWDTAGRVLLTGEEGHGKSEVAAEYAHRFLGAYDTVHWISADNVFKAREGLRRLGERLGIATGGDAVQAVLAHLATPRSGRWLLVYDNADRPEVLRDLVPGVRPFGHVIVTSRTRDWGDGYDDRLDVTAFSAPDAVELLTEGDVGIPPADADRIASAVGRLPLALEMARAWLSRELNSTRRTRRPIAELHTATIDRFLGAYDRTERELRGRTGGQFVSPHRVMVEISLDALRGQPGGTGAEWLLEACAFLSPEGASLAMLRSSRSRGYVAATDSDYADELMVDVVLRLVHTYALVRVDLGRRGMLRMHRLVAKQLRGRMPPAERATRNRQVLALLARHSPTDAEGVENELFDELGKHLIVSKALESDDEMVCRWVIGQIRYLYLLDDRTPWLRAKEIGITALRHWERHANVPLLAGLRMQMSNVHRALGEHKQAFDLSQRALRDLSGPQRPHPLMYVAATLHAADLRVSGDYDEAYNWDFTAWDGLNRLLGPDHAWTGRAMNNLAASASLNGKPHLALDTSQERIARRTRLYGDADPAALWTACNAAHFMRDLGRYDDAYDLLKTCLEHLAHEQTKGGPRTLLALRLENGLGVTERFLGRPFEALTRNTEALEELRALVGDRNLYTMLCAMSVAADLHARGDHDGAVLRSRRSAQDIARLYGEHPMRYAAQVNLAIHLRGQGERQESEALAKQAHEWLRARLGTRHPYTMAAAVTVANGVVDTDPDRALRLEASVLEYLARLFGPAHPHTRVVQGNHENTRHRKVGRAGALAAGRRDLGIEILGY